MEKSVFILLCMLCRSFRNAANEETEYTYDANGNMLTDSNKGITSIEYNVLDHLGSNRLVVDGNGNIEDVNHYYPFGALMGDRCGVSRNKYKYIGKELDMMYGWNMQDHEARWYDPVVGRWMATDPLQEKYASFSIYYYANNNPLVFIDLNGKDGVRIVDEDNKTLTIKADCFVITAAQQYRDNNIINVFKGYSSKDIEKLNSYNEYLNNIKLIVPAGEYKGYSILFDLEVSKA